MSVVRESLRDFVVHTGFVDTDYASKTRTFELLLQILQR
jgi:hypothetical protein